MALRHTLAWEQDVNDRKREVKIAKYENLKWRRLAMLHYQDGEFEDALKAFQQAIKCGSMPALLWLSLARCNVQLYHVRNSCLP